MDKAILLAAAACCCTAASSVCQRLGAYSLGAGETGVFGFDPMLVFRLARRPLWLLGFACMFVGFAFHQRIIDLEEIELLAAYQLFNFT